MVSALSVERQPMMGSLYSTMEAIGADPVVAKVGLMTTRITPGRQRSYGFVRLRQIYSDWHTDRRSKRNDSLLLNA